MQLHIIIVYPGLCLDISIIFSVFISDFITKLIPEQHEATQQTKIQEVHLVIRFALNCFHEPEGFLPTLHQQPICFTICAWTSSIAEFCIAMRLPLKGPTAYELKPCNFNFYSTPLQLLEWPCCAVRGDLGMLAFFILGLIPVMAHSAAIIIWLGML